MTSAIKHALLFLLLLLGSTRTYATHIYGADFYYTYIAGNTYTLTLDIYGDCSGLQFPRLSSGMADVDIYNGSTYARTVQLALKPPTAGTEVSAVCPSQLVNTTCNGGTIPGVTKFTYTTTINLSVASTDWRFLFNGSLGTSSAGRSGTIININTVAGVMVLEATLNNTVPGTNSSATYTTIPTPFFGENIPASFNPGSVDVNGDSLTYELVSGIETSGTTFSPHNCAYNFPYSPTNPISVTPGSMSFDGATGQLDFTPNMVHNALVVYKVNEFRNGVLVGSSMREMTFVIWSGTNNAPTASIPASSVSGGARITRTKVAICQGQIGFSLQPRDVDGDNVSVSATGLPAGASFTTTGNGTTTPSCNFSWNTSAAAPGTYTFFVTYTDDGCPMISRQTVAYSVVVTGLPRYAYSLVPPTCTRKGYYKLTGARSSDTMRLTLFQGSTVIRNAATTTGVFADSITHGTYTVRLTNFLGCSRDTTIVINDPNTTKLSIAFDKPSCNQFSDGAITITAFNGNAPYRYALDAGAYSSTAIYTGLHSGTYTIRTLDAQQCFKDTVITLDDSIRLTGGATATNVLCNGDANGVIAFNGVSSAYGGPYVYKLDGVVQPATVFANLAPATYIVRAQDIKGCYLQDTITITEPDKLLGNAIAKNISCFGANDGSITLTPTGGTPGFAYSLNGAGLVKVPQFTGLSKGVYIVATKDTNSCTDLDTLTIIEPSKIFILGLSLTHPLCHDSANGTVTVSAQGGTPPYVLSAQNSVSATNTLTGLSSGNVQVRITDANGCTKDTIVVLAAPPIVKATIDIKKATCNALDDGRITVQGSGGFGQYTYALGDGEFVLYGRFNGLSGGEYTVRVRDANYCIIDAKVVVPDSLQIHTTAQVTDVSCYGYNDGQVTFTPAGGVAPYSFAFNEEGSFSSNAIYTGYAMGTYHVWLKDSLGCEGDTVIQINQPQPLLIDTDVVYNDCYNNTLNGKIEVKVTGGTTPYLYTWSNGTTGAEPILSSIPNGSYRVEVKDAHGCMITAGALLEYKDCCSPFMPGAFTPNGDGRNDVFRIRSKGDITLKELQVFNRFGQRVFVSNDIDKGWDGSFNGVPADPGTYFYLLKASCGNNNERVVEMKGDIVLIR